MSLTSLIRVSAPAEKAISVADAKSWLRVVYDAEDTLIELLVDAAIDRLDGPQGLLNRALITQEWTAHYSCYEPVLRIPLTRCSAITSVSWVDASGNTVTADPADYDVVGLYSDRCTVRPKSTWAAQSVSITFKAGFGDDPGDVPATLRHSLLEMVADGFENRQSIVVGSGAEQAVSMRVIPSRAREAISDWRVLTADDLLYA